MSDYGVFEASSTDGHEEEQRQRQATRDLGRAIESAREGFGDFLGAATDKQDYQDRLALVMNDLMQKVADSGVMPVPGVMRKVKAALRPQFRESAGWSKGTSPDISDLSKEQLQEFIDNIQEAIDAGVNVGQINENKRDRFQEELRSRSASRKQAALRTAAGLNEFENMLRANWGASFNEFLNEFDEESQRDAREEFKNTFGVTDADLNGFLPSIGASLRKKADSEAGPNAEALAWAERYYERNKTGDGVDTWRDALGLAGDEFGTNFSAEDYARHSSRKQAYNDGDAAEAAAAWAESLGYNDPWGFASWLVGKGYLYPMSDSEYQTNLQLFQKADDPGVYSSRKTAGDLDDFESWVSEEANSVYDSASASRYLSTFPSGEEPFNNDPDALLYAYENQFAEASRKQASDIPWFTNHGGSEEVRFSNGSYMLINPDGSWQVGDGTFMTTGQESSVERAKEVATEQLFFFGSKSAKRKQANDYEAIADRAAEDFERDTGNDPYTDPNFITQYLPAWASANAQDIAFDPALYEELEMEANMLGYGYTVEGKRKRAGVDSDVNSFVLYLQGIGYRMPKDAGYPGEGGELDDELHGYFKGDRNKIDEVTKFLQEKWDYYAYGIGASRKQASDVNTEDQDVLQFFYQFEDEGLDVSASGDEQWEWLKSNIDYDTLQDAIDQANEYGEVSRSNIDSMAYDLQQNFFGSRKQASAYLPVVSVEQDTGDSYMAELKGGFAFEAYDEGGTWVWNIFDNSGEEVASDETFSLDAAKDDAAYALERVASRKQAFSEQLGVHLTEVFESGEASGGWRPITGERLDWEKGDLEFYGGSGFFRDYSDGDDGEDADVFNFSTNDDSVIIDAAWKAVDYANGIQASRKTATPKDTLIFDSLSELLLNGGLSPEDEDAIERAYDQAEQGKWQAAYNSVTFVADGPDLSAGADRLVESILDDIESLVGDPSRKVDSRRKQALELGEWEEDLPGLGYAKATKTPGGGWEVYIWDEAGQNETLTPVNSSEEARRLFQDTIKSYPGSGFDHIDF